MTDCRRFKVNWPAFTARRYAIARYMLRPCVCVSVWLYARCSIKMAERIAMESTPYDGPGTDFETHVL